MLEPRDCSDCLSYDAWTETSGEMFALCKHPKRNERFWGENPGEYFAVNECPWFADREAVRCAVNGIET